MKFLPLDLSTDMSYGSSHDLDGIQNSEADHYNSGIYGQPSENNIDQDKLKNPKQTKLSVSAMQMFLIIKLRQIENENNFYPL